jgi:Ca2+-binding EF-hand superfamily protein
MSMGAQRKMNLIEFTVLMNRAYAFLGVKVDDQGCKAIFDDADSDKDGIISYEEYFSFVHKHILKPKPSDEVVKPVPTLDEFISLLRQYLWAQARRIYDIYDKDKNQKLDVKEFGEVIKAIMTDYSDADVIEMLTRSFKLNLSPDGFLKFEVFAPFFIVCLGKLGLSKFARHHPKKRTLTREEFTLLFKRSYNILGAQRVTDNLLSLFFSAIDTNHDGKITYAEYLDWIVNFLSVSKYFGTLRLLEDTPPDRLRMILPDSELESNAYYVTKFKFSNLDLARRARLRTLELILEFDANKNSNLEEDEIINILKKLMKSDDFDVFYVIANVFRYDVNNDGFITYDEMADFFLEMHFGELALQRLHRIRKFLRGDERLMNFDEFSLTLENGLSYIGVVATKEELATLFSEIDLDKSGWITYKIYLEFLIAYFGTKSKVRYELDFKSKVDKTLANTKLSPIERLGDIVIKALKELLKDYNPFNSLDAEKIRKFLMEIFKLTPSEAEYVLLNLLRSELFTGVLNEMALAILFMEILFAEIMLTRWHRQKKFKRWMERLISQDEFVQLVGETCFWIQPAIPTGLLIEIFKLLDTDNDGFITYDQYINFVLQMFKLKHKRQWPFEIASEKVDTPALTKELSEDIWSDLRALYMHYVKGKYLQENELELLVKEVLHETTKKELEYIFWNMFRYDPNGDKNIEFEEFVKILVNQGTLYSCSRSRNCSSKVPL